MTNDRNRAIAKSAGGLCRAAFTALRLAMLLLVLAVPALSIPSFANDRGTILEGSPKRSSGAGLVIMVSLQRAR